MQNWNIDPVVACSDYAANCQKGLRALGIVIDKVGIVYGAIKLIKDKIWKSSYRRVAIIIVSVSYHLK